MFSSSGQLCRLRMVVNARVLWPLPVLNSSTFSVSLTAPSEDSVASGLSFCCPALFAEGCRAACLQYLQVGFSESLAVLGQICIARTSPVKEIQKSHGAARSREEPRGAARSREEPRGAARSREEPRGAARSRQEPPGAARSCRDVPREAVPPGDARTREELSPRRSREELRKGAMRRSHQEPRGARQESHGSSHDKNASSQWEGGCAIGYTRARPSDARSIHCCQLVNSITFGSWSIRFEEYPQLFANLLKSWFLEHLMRVASTAGNLTTFGSKSFQFEEHSPMPTE